MAGRLDGRVALVTGGGGGIGEATARLFWEEGARVALVDAVPGAAERAARGIDAAGERTLGLTADLAQEPEAERAVRETAARFGALHVLANVAGVRLYGPLTEATADSWQWIIGANLLSYAYCAKFAIPEMARAGGGSIVNVSSTFGARGRAGMVQYDTTKAGIIGMTRAMACDHAPQRVRVNAVCPGGTITPYHINRRAEQKGISYEAAEAEIRAAGSGNLIGRQAEPRDIAYSILFLASDEAACITGTYLMVDGGTRGY